MALSNSVLNDLGDRQDVDDEQEEQPRLVFPINIHESLQASAGLRKGEKVGIIASIWAFVCFLLGWFLAGWLRSLVPNYYWWIVIGVELALQLTVGMYILRFALDERSVFAEMNTSSQSFAQYFKIYREIVSKEGTKYPFDVIEFDDGSYGVFIQCRLGHNTQQRSDGTYDANKELVEILNKSSLPRKTFFHNEMFKTSEAAQDLRDILKGIEDPTLFSTYRDIIQNYLRIAEEESNVASVTHIVFAPSRVAKDELLATMHNVFNVLERDDTAYRQVTALKYDEIVEFLRHHYRLEVLDMGIIRAHIAEKRSGFNCAVTVLKLYGKSGKIYSKESFKKINDEVIKDFGLKVVN